MSEETTVSIVRSWIEMEAEFFGRTDDDFILIFLRGCKFDVEKCKKKMTLYYECRRKHPKWWANRNLNEPRIIQLLNLNISIMLLEKSQNEPSVIITRMNKLEKHLIDFDEYVRMHSLVFETIVRRPSCQINGLEWVIDCSDMPTWMAKQVMNPITVKNIICSFYLTMPIRIQKILVFNQPLIATVAWMFIQPFLTPKLKKRVRFFGNDWSKLMDNVSATFLPVEYGGNAEPINYHEEHFLKEVLSLNHYILDDNKYGSCKIIQ